MTTNSWEFCSWDEVQRIGNSGVRSDRNIVVIDFSCNGILESDVLKNGAEFDCLIDFGLLDWVKPNTLGVAAALDVKNSLIARVILNLRPAMLVITDQSSLRISTECGLSSTGEPEQQCDISLLDALIAAGVK